MVPIFRLFLFIVACLSDVNMGQNLDRPSIANSSIHSDEALSKSSVDTLFASKQNIKNESILYEIPVASRRANPFLVQTVLSRKTDTTPNGTFSSTGSNSYYISNSHNVINLVRNIDSRLRNIRNFEMLITTIQEIFDSVDFTSASSVKSDSSKRNESDYYSFHISSMRKTAQALQTVSKRLSEKLQKATHVVTELRQFFRTNITNLLIQKTLKSCETKKNTNESCSDIQSMHISSFDSKKLVLNTLIHSSGDALPNKKTNYNKDQIEILNNLKTDNFLNKHGTSLPSYDYSFEANRNIANKIRSLHSDFSKSNSSPINLQNTPNAIPSGLFKSNFKDVFFLSCSDHTSDNAQRVYNDFHLRRLFVSAVRNKLMFLLLDIGSPLSTHELDLTKLFVLNMIKLLSDTDMISIVTVSNVVKSVMLGKKEEWNVSQIYFTTRDLREELVSSINNLNVSNNLTNHTLGFEYSFKLLEAMQTSKVITHENPIEFVYITGGFLANLSDAIHVLSVIAEGQSKLLTPIVINTCAVVLDKNNVMYEKQFLRDIALQDYTKYNINVSSWREQKKITGNLFVINKSNPESIIHSSTAIFDTFFHEPFLSPNLEVHEPVVNYSSKDIIISMTHAVPLFGVIGVNLYLSDLVEDVINYNSQESSLMNCQTYAFLIDRSGRTIAHPAFDRPSSQMATSFNVDIGVLENSTDFISIRQHIMDNEFGNLTTTVQVQSKNNDKPEILNRSYIWKNILGMYILCFTTTSQREPKNNSSMNIGKSSPTQLSSVPLSLQETRSVKNVDILQRHEHIQNFNLLYHRLDLIPPRSSPVCRYFRQISTLEVGTIFLGSRAFESTFAYLQNNRYSYMNHQLRTIESIMAYIKDNTGLLANPGLRSPVRNDIYMLYRAMHYLKERHQDPRGTFKNYIIRRYISTVNGVLQVYPGCLLSNNYDPMNRPWFKKAMQNPGKIIITEPYIDAGGAGYIMSIAHTIFEGKSNALHSFEHDKPVAVVVLDVPYTFFYKLVIESTPLCRQKNIKCLLFENEGYLVAHPSMLEPSTANYNQRRPHEHLTHKESFLANDILNHKQLVKKLACANHQNRTLQRYYVFNTSLNDILTNVVHGERTKYSISVLRGSNIFAAVLNSTCDGGAFCPCSTINRICLNCNRMDQTDCECPCECPMDMKNHRTALNREEKLVSSSYSFSNISRQYPFCEPSSEELIILPSLNDANVMPSCLKINCETYVTQIDCLAVIGCEWCQLDMDGNVFTSAFCTSQMSCFNGVLSSLGPYDDDDESDMLAVHVYNSGQNQNSYSAFGPVGGAIIVLGLVIGFAIYCYRNHVDSHSQNHFYVDSLQGDNCGIPLSRFNVDDCQPSEEASCGIAGCGSAAQRNLINSANMSPYHMSSASSYNRPPNGESDHGYSTMTPHDDYTDQQSFTLVEPLLLNDKRNSKSDTMSVSTSISSPTNRNQQLYMQTQYGISRENTSWRHMLPSPKEVESTSHLHKSCYQNKNQTNPIVINSSEEPVHLHHILAPVTVHRHMELTEA